MIRLPFNTRIHGVLACGGSGTRFARSRGARSPYPKHLEQVAGKTVLERSVESMIAFTGTNSITITLNPLLAQQYIEEIKKIAERHKNIEFSYLISTETKTDGIPLSQLKNDLRNGATTLNNKRVKFNENDPLIIGPGDTFLTGQDNGRLKKDIQDFVGQRSNDVSGVGPSEGFVYLIIKPSNLNDDIHPHLALLSDYGLGFVTINQQRDISNAEGQLTSIER